MRKTIILTALAVALSTLAGCLSSPMQAILYTGTKHTLHDRSPGSVLSDASPVKRGESCSASTYLFSVAFVFYGTGGSIEEAAKSGGIKKIATVERSSMSVLGPIFYRECVVVWGE